jgi:hypothetical protein
MSDALKPLFGDLTDGIDRLARRAKAAATLTEQVRAALPEPLRAHVVSANERRVAGANGRGGSERGSNERGGDETGARELVVIVDSAAWAARVRYASRRLREALASNGAGRFDKLRVRVRAPLGK